MDEHTLGEGHLGSDFIPNDFTCWQVVEQISIRTGCDGSKCGHHVNLNVLSELIFGFLLVQVPLNLVLVWESVSLSDFLRIILELQICVVHVHCNLD